MGQARRRGDYSQRVEQAKTMNSVLQQEIESLTHSSNLKFLKHQMDKNGVQKFRMSTGKHYEPTENTQPEQPTSSNT